MFSKVTAVTNQIDLFPQTQTDTIPQKSNILKMFRSENVSKPSCFEGNPFSKQVIYYQQLAAVLLSNYVSPENQTIVELSTTGSV